MSSEPDRQEAGPIEPTPKEALFMLGIVKYMKGTPEVDWDKVASNAGLKSGSVASVRFGQIKRRLGWTTGASPSPKKSARGQGNATPSPRKPAKRKREETGTPTPNAKKGKNIIKADDDENAEAKEDSVQDFFDSAIVYEEDSAE